MTKIKKILKK